MKEDGMLWDRLFVWSAQWAAETHFWVGSSAHWMLARLGPKLCAMLSQQGLQTRSQQAGDNLRFRSFRIFGSKYRFKPGNCPVLLFNSKWQMNYALAAYRRISPAVSFCCCLSWK